MPSKTKTYEVVGAAPVLDHQPGETFEASLDKGTEEFLMNTGALKVVQKKKSDD